jgi:peroxiredoxin Q/BCP
LTENSAGSQSSPTRLAPGDTAPDFTLATDTGEQVSLSALRGKKVIVYFYPAAMTPGCTTQACDFTDSLDSLRGAGFEVVGISPDKPAKLAKFRERDGLTITLASDEDRATMTAYGAFGEKKLYGKVVQGVIRSTIVVDEEGLVEVAQYNVKATGHVAKLSASPARRSRAESVGGAIQPRCVGRVHRKYTREMLLRPPPRRRSSPAGP